MSHKRYVYPTSEYLQIGLNLGKLKALYLHTQIKINGTTSQNPKFSLKTH